MILPFSTHHNNKPTYFIEKIWEGILRYLDNEEASDTYHSYIVEHEARFGRAWDYLPEDQPGMKFPKIHTIRADRGKRWKPGNIIHFVINNRTKNYFQFAEMPCTAVQDIEILYFNLTPRVFVEGHQLAPSQVDLLARNDGFNSTKEFFAWFSSDFTGRIIHWTDYIYKLPLNEFAMAAINGNRDLVRELLATGIDYRDAILYVESFHGNEEASKLILSLAFCPCGSVAFKWDGPQPICRSCHFTQSLGMIDYKPAN